MAEDRGDMEGDIKQRLKYAAYIADKCMEANASPKDLLEAVARIEELEAEVDRLTDCKK